MTDTIVPRPTLNGLAAGITAAVEIVTPEAAEAMLTGNKVNRRLRPQRVALYAKQMQRGQWRVTGETIVFGPSGQLLQGQHRLSACVAAGVPIATVIVRGVDPEAMKVMDTGAARTASDTLTLAGVKHTATVASAIRSILAIQGGFQSSTSRMALITRDELLDFLAANEALLAVAVEASGPIYGQLRQSRSAWTALAFMLMEADRDLAAEFLDGLGSGAGMAVGDPRLALRAYVLNGMAQRRKFSWQELVANGIRTWNSWINGKEVSHLKGWKPAHKWPEIES